MGKRILKEKTVKKYNEEGILMDESIEKVTSVKTSADTFYMVFINFIGWMYKIKSGAVLQVLMKLAAMADYNTGEVLMSGSNRDDILEELQISSSSLVKAINQLLENKAIAPVYKKVVNQETGEEVLIPKRGKYKINPEMFWKGDLRKRSELIITFSSKTEDFGNSAQDPYIEAEELLNYGK